jgi:pyruvate kinase
VKHDPAPSRPLERTSLAVAARELSRLQRCLDDLEGEMRGAIERVPEERRESARNLVHYVALRQHDLRSLQHELVQLGLSSLGRSEGSVRGSVLAVARRVYEALTLRGDAHAMRELARLDHDAATALDWDAATRLLHQHTRELLGAHPEDRHVCVMVTAPSAAEADARWMAKVLSSGMNVLRINCAHEGPAEWARTLRALDEGRKSAGTECRVVMDLAGPKIRTGEIVGGRRVVTYKPAKDEIGRITTPARVVLRRGRPPRGEATPATLFVADDEFTALRRGDVLRFRDARGKKRELAVVSIGEGEAIAHATRRTYVLESAEARVVRKGERVADVALEAGFGEGAFVDVRAGDLLVLTGRDEQGRPPRRDGEGRVVRPGVVACTLPAALDELAAGQRVLFDDGRVEAIVEKVNKARRDHVLRVLRTDKPTVKLRAEKGINLPDTAITIPALTREDLAALAFAGEHADAVSLSFVREPSDVARLHEELDRLGRPGMGVVLKIETKAGFENLPRLLLEGLRRPPLGVMIARGDLAVEVGFERLAELQEEILWLCEASHVPAIWATQVLDTLARTGIPSRAEVTDAAASVAAECVMLNKGPFVAQAVAVLADILRRMEKHHFKKRSLYRKLRVSTFAPVDGDHASEPPPAEPARAEAARVAL